MNQTEWVESKKEVRIPGLMYTLYDIQDLVVLMNNKDISDEIKAKIFEAIKRGPHVIAVFIDNDKVIVMFHTTTWVDIDKTANVIRFMELQEFLKEFDIL